MHIKDTEYVTINTRLISLHNIKGTYKDYWLKWQNNPHDNMWVTKLMNPCDDKTNFHDDTMIKKLSVFLWWKIHTTTQWQQIHKYT